MTIEVHQFPCLSDNYCWLVRDEAAEVTAVVDTPEVEPINRALEEKGWKLTHIFNTHHHFDHAGGNAALKAQWGCTIVGADVDAERIPGIDVRLKEGETYTFGNSRTRVVEVPGHTSGHVAFHFEKDKIAFVGDTIFALGCGRLFEGTPAQMWDSICKLMNMPDETTLYCAHEYTAANASFALSVEPGNAELIERAAEIKRLRAEGKPTVPTTLAREKATTPFLRPQSANLQETVGLVGAPLVDVFAETRRRKDNF